MRPEDCYVIEDSVAGLTAAQRAGMTPVCFMGSEMYRNNPAQRQAVEALGITHIFYDMAEVKEFLKRKRRYGQRARGKRAREKSDCQKIGKCRFRKGKRHLSSEQQVEIYDKTDIAADFLRFLKISILYLFFIIGKRAILWLLRRPAFKFSA